MNNIRPNNSQILLYQTVEIGTKINNDTVWFSLDPKAELFQDTFEM